MIGEVSGRLASPPSFSNTNSVCGLPCVFSFLLRKTITRRTQESNRVGDGGLVAARLGVLKAAMRKILLVLLVCRRLSSKFCNVHT